MDRRKMSIALSGKNNPMYGKHHSEETRKKLSIAMSGKNNPNYGKNVSEETRRKISLANKGQIPWNRGKKTGPLSEGHKRKLSVAQRGENNGFYGKKHTTETKSKMSEAKSGEKNPMHGRRQSEETKRRISEVLKESALVDNAGCNNPMYGRNHSKETRAKMREARLSSDYIFPVKDTSIEVAMQGELGVRGIVFEKHVPLLGRYRVDIKIGDLIIECDGNYWHDFPDGTEKDRRRDAALKEAGYGVLRFWGSEINADVSRCVDSIEEVLG